MADSKGMPSDVLGVARRHFGFDSLRPGQEQAIRSVLSGRDTVLVQPTGAGKSAIYQIAGLMIHGVTVVISPLIALQKDQVDSINEANASEAVLVNSQLRAAEHREVIDKIEDGQVEYIFLAPEQLRNQETIERLEASGISLFVVDEAHCISGWGHDFRPDYLQLGQAIERFGHPTVLAMTATASPEMRQEIIERLGLRNPKVIVHGFDRPNIHLRVDHFQTEKEKTEALIRRIQFAPKPGIVYVASRKNAENIMRSLKEMGVHALFYHAGLKAQEREAIQEQFMSGDAEVMVATNAFGMGVDKSDIRFVYHFDISDSLDSYYQEIGRAGRDGEAAEAVLFFRTENVGTQKFRTGRGNGAAAQAAKVAEAIAEANGVTTPAELAEKTGLAQRTLTTVLHRLQDAGAIVLLPSGEVQLTEGGNLIEAAEGASQQQELHKEHRREKLRQMQEYADSRSCRREILLRYFGDDADGVCHNCDNCESIAGKIPASSGAGTRREVV